MWINWNTCILLVGIQNGAVVRQNNMEASKKNVKQSHHIIQ